MQLGVVYLTFLENLKAFLLFNPIALVLNSTGRKIDANKIFGIRKIFYTVIWDKEFKPIKCSPYEVC